jgi:LemA protein
MVATRSHGRRHGVWIILGIALVVAVTVVVGMYNSLVRLRVLCDSAWADIDVQLKRRCDLIPGIVETVKGYAQHEKQTLEAVVSARARAMGAERPAARAEAESALGNALRQLFALVETYPQLRAVESFTSLQATLGELESTIQDARRYYNAVVRDLNTRIAVFPSSLIAGAFGFTPREFFELAEAAERQAPKVKF